MITASAKIVWNPQAKKKLEEVGDKITYEIASRTLDMSYTLIPKDTKKMAQTSKKAGVRGANGHYYIGSYTNYATYVWVMPKTTNWTEPGTQGMWYDVAWKKYGKTITSECIRKAGIK